jgi:hypothetical protein
MEKQELWIWREHDRCNPSKDFKMTIKCKVCQTKFKVSNEKNLEKKDISMYLDWEIKHESKHRYTRNKFEKAVVYKSVCPNCNKKEELFCSANDETFFSEWELNDRDPNVY